MDKEVGDEIASQIHGTSLGADSSQIHCDGFHGRPRTVDPGTRIQYECIRVGESMTNLRKFDVPDVWGPDLLRCPDCEIEALELPTDGYAEALVEVDIDHSGESYVIDATDLTLLDYSPVDEGEDPPKVPMGVFAMLIETRDFGAFRRSRLAPSLSTLRDNGATTMAEFIEDSL